MTTELRKLLAALIANLQVHRSLPGKLGVAAHSYDELRKELDLFGWQTAEEIEKEIMRYEARKESEKMFTRKER